MRVKWGWPRGRVVGFARSAAGGLVFRWFESWARTWHCSSGHAGGGVPLATAGGTHNEEYTTMYRGLGEKEERIKSLKKKKNESENMKEPIGSLKHTLNLSFDRSKNKMTSAKVFCGSCISRVRYTAAVQCLGLQIL